MRITESAVTPTHNDIEHSNVDRLVSSVGRIISLKEIDGVQKHAKPARSKTAKSLKKMVLLARFASKPRGYTTTKLTLFHSGAIISPIVTQNPGGNQPKTGLCTTLRFY